MESARQKFGIAKIRYRLGVRSSFEANRTRVVCKIAPATSLRCCRWRPAAMMIPLQPPGPTSVSARSRLAKRCFASGCARPARTLALRALRLRLRVHLQLLLRCASHIQRKGGTNPKDESELNRTHPVRGPSGASRCARACKTAPAVLWQPRTFCRVDSHASPTISEAMPRPPLKSPSRPSNLAYREIYLPKTPKNFSFCKKSGEHYEEHWTKTDHPGKVPISPDFPSFRNTTPHKIHPCAPQLESSLQPPSGQETPSIPPSPAKSLNIA